MAIIYYYGDIPVEKEEALEKTAIGDLTNGYLSKSSSTRKINFREGIVDIPALVDNSALDLPPFTPLGINKPLFIEILCTYSGDVPRKFLGGKPDILTVSGVKSYTTYGAAPRAINQIKHKVKDHTFLRFSAFDVGSPVVYYTPAVDVGTIYCSFEMVADTFNENLFQTLSRLFGIAGGLPIFAPAAPFLLAGSVISSMIGSLGKVIAESKAFLKDDEEFRFDGNIIPLSIAKQLAICNQEDTTKLKAYKPGLVTEPDGSKTVALVHRQSGEPYKGDAPYMLVNIDGKRKPELENYTSKLATAAVLEKYYGSQSRGELTANVIETAMKLYNDFSYHQKALELSKDIEQLSEGSAEYIKAMDLLEAYKNNIQSEQFKISNQ